MTYNQSKINTVIKNFLLSATFVASVAFLSYPLVNPVVVTAQDAVETEREKKFEEMLLLNIPTETDNPNYAIVFTDPSGKGIFISVDGAEERQISSPYLLPTLAVGSHKLTIRFTDNEETPQILEKRIVIVPRSPILKIPQTTTKDKIEINGTAMPNATVRIFMAGPTATYKSEVASDVEGLWEYIFTDEFSEGVYTVTALTTKNGFASQFGEEVIFKISTSDVVVVGPEKVEKPISFTFDSLVKSDPVDLFNSNRELFYLVGGTLLAGLLLGFLLTKVGSGRGTKKAEDQFLRLLREKTTNGIGKSMDLLNTEKAENRVVDKLSKKQEITVSVEEKTETESTVTVTDETKSVESVTSDDKTETKSVEAVNVEEKVEKKLTISTDTATISTAETEDKAPEPIIETEAEIQPEIVQPDEKLEVEAPIDEADLEVDDVEEQVEEKTEDTEVKVVKTGFFSGLFAKFRPKQTVKIEYNDEVDPDSTIEDEPSLITGPKETNESTDDIFGTKSIDLITDDSDVESISTESSEDNSQTTIAATSKSETTKEITKEEFLAKFKEYDPDEKSVIANAESKIESVVESQVEKSEDKTEERTETPDIEHTRSKFEQSPVTKDKTKKDRNIKITLTTGSLK